MRSPPAMTAANALPVTPPWRPREDVIVHGRVRPDQTPELPAQLGHGVRQQLLP